MVGRWNIYGELCRIDRSVNFQCILSRMTSTNSGCASLFLLISLPKPHHGFKTLRFSFLFFSVSFFLFYLARTGNWILERSSDGVTFEPWQYYAITETECLTRFNINPKTGPPSYARDDEVICTSFYSKIHPLENGEVTSTRALPFVALWSIAELGF